MREALKRNFFKDKYNLTFQLIFFFFQTPWDPQNMDLFKESKEQPPPIFNIFVKT